MIETADARMREGIKRAIELGAGAPDLAEDSGLTVTRIGQIVGGVRRVRAAAGIPNPKRKRTGPIPSQAPAAEEPGTPA